MTNEEITALTNLADALNKAIAASDTPVIVSKLADMVHPMSTIMQVTYRESNNVPPLVR